MKKIIWYTSVSSPEQNPLRYTLRYFHNVDCSFDQFGVLETLDPIGSRYVLQQDLTKLVDHPATDFELILQSVHAGLNMTWAAGRKAVIMYSGGIDSTALLTACILHPQLEEKMEEGLFVVELNSMSIKELPSFFSQHISGKLKYRLFDFTKGPSSSETYFGGDHGDVIFGSNSFTKLVDKLGPEVLDADYPVNSLRDFYHEQDPSGKVLELSDELANFAPFKISCAIQYAWWFDISTSFQREFLRSFINTPNPIDVSKVVQPLYFYRSYGTQEMISRAVKYFANYKGVKNLNEMKLPLRQFTYQFTKNDEIMKKRKVHSQNFFARRIYKTIMYDDGSYRESFI